MFTIHHCFLTLVDNKLEHLHSFQLKVEIKVPTFVSHGHYTGKSLTVLYSHKNTERLKNWQLVRYFSR